MNKVYVLVTDSIYPGGATEIRTRVFKSRAAAAKVMRAEYAAELNDWKQTFDDDEMFDVETDKDNCAIWESGRYIENHNAWSINECEVE